MCPGASMLSPQYVVNELVRHVEDTTIPAAFGTKLPGWSVANESFTVARRAFKPLVDHGIPLVIWTRSLIVLRFSDDLIDVGCCRSEVLSIGNAGLP